MAVLQKQSQFGAPGWPGPVSQGRALPHRSADGYNPGEEFFGLRALIWGAGIHIFVNAEFSAPVHKGNPGRRVALGDPGKQGLTT